MKKLLSFLAGIALCTQAHAQTINALGAGSAVSATDIFPAYQGSNPATGVTAAQVKTFTSTSAGLGAAVSLVANTAPGTGYVPGEIITPAISGATASSLYGATNTALISVTDTKVISATVTAGGTTCTNGASQTVTGTTGTGTKFQALVTVSGNAITAVNSISVAGDYTVNPTSIAAEPVTGDSCTGAQLNVTMGVLYAYVPNMGYYSVIPGATGTATQASSSGSGTGATFTATFLPVSAYVLPPNQFSPLSGSSANENFFLGSKAGIAVTTGTEDTGFGWQALRSITTGLNSSGFGTGACMSVVAGSNNSCFGADSGRNFTGGTSITLYGTNSLKSSTGTNSNSISVFGASAALNWSKNQNGDANLAVFGANNECQGTGTATFLNMTCMGSKSGQALTSAANGTLIGYNVGNTCASGAGNLLISSGQAAVDCASGTTANTVNVENMWLASATGTPATATSTFHGSTVVFPDIANSTTAQTGSLCWSAGGITYDNTNTCLVSSARFKHAIEPLADGIATVMALKPVKFEYNDQATSPGEHMGFLAEDVAKVEPGLTVNDDEGKPLKIKYLEMSALLVSAIKDLKAENDNLRACNDNWKCRLFGIR